MSNFAENIPGKAYVGIDVGSVSVKVAVIGDENCRHLFQKMCANGKFFSKSLPENGKILRSKQIVVSQYQRVLGEPVKVTYEILKALFEYIPAGKIGNMRVTGCGGKCISELLNIKFENEFRAAANGVGLLYPQVRTILEMGGDNSRYLRIDVDPSNGMFGIVDYEKNGDCAAGTGSFMDQQASRLLYEIEEVGDIVMAAVRTANIAGRCSVFAKSDMIHAQQKGFQPPEVLKGLCEAVVRNFKGTITKGKEILPRVAFIGGVAANKGVAEAVKELLKLGDEEFFVPGYYAWMGAIGAAFLALASKEKNKPRHLQNLQTYSQQANDNFPFTGPLSLDKVVLLRQMIKPYPFEGKNGKIRCYLGVDIGSVSTNLAIIDEDGDVVKEIYTKTNARPIEVVGRCLKEIDSELGDEIHILGVGTTGSGRELIGELIGADSINDEITAHKTGAMHIGKKLTRQKVDTIFDIGGQDSKFISIEDEIVVDFTMNEACAAGTGSFLEEQAERLGIDIKNQFAEMALRSKKPLRLGERCTVFMEQDVKSCLLRSACKEDIAAGLAYSVVINYLNRVVRGRKIGNVIYFQGGTAYNDSVAAAFSSLLHKEIIVPPYNGVIGAVGAALLAREKMTMSHRKTAFRGFNLDSVNYSMRNFMCKGCPNHCDVSEFNVEGEKTYWGDKCSQRYRTKTRSEKKPVIEDLVKLREQVLLERYQAKANFNGGPRIGLARSLYFHDRFPFWNTFFTELGFQVVISGETNKQIVNWGLDALVAEPCFPIAVAHGHLQDLIEKGVDYVFQPNVINAQSEFPQTQSWFCSWGQTLPFVFCSNPSFKAYKKQVLRPTIHFREGIKVVKKELGRFAVQLGRSKARAGRAIEKAQKIQEEFELKLQQAGQKALETLATQDELGIVLLGRPYNIYDKTINLNVPGKLRKFYGVNVIPLDFLPLDFIDIYDVNENMFWHYGKKIMQAAKFVKQYANLHIIYITNFKCGPDSYLKHYIREASNKPFLSLQFDGHSNDAGIMTRCEAYLDSKGFLRWWKPEKRQEIFYVNTE
jgi:predicted CoA-substrate-specific enzyme activase